MLKLVGCQQFIMLRLSLSMTLCTHNFSYSPSFFVFFNFYVFHIPQALINTVIFFLPSPPSDIRDLVQVEDVMEDEDLKLGPNGGLVFCLE